MTTAPAPTLADGIDTTVAGATSLTRIRLSTSDDWREWTVRHAPALRALLTSAALVLENAPVSTPADLAFLAEAVGGRLMEYTERSTPRTRIDSNVYTSTEYPKDQEIPQHNENSYSDTWPWYLFFLCQTPAVQGGQTPVADGRTVLRLLPPDLVARFRERGVRYSRTFRAGLGLSWQDTFQTTDRAEVERYCAAHGIDARWRGDLLQTSQHRPATVRHPVTGEEAWFNQAHLFHVKALPSEVRQSMLQMYADDELPRNASYGTGEPITDDDLAAIDAAYGQARIGHAWAAGDVLMIDNHVMSHGRQRYTGERSVAVAMTGAR
jgi:alpha-ketoglutarate-dependent taurine dioxygenase